MKGLLLKEYYVLQFYKKMVLVYIVIFGGSAVITGTLSLFGIMPSVLLITLTLSGFSHDEQAGWDKMAVASPVGRKAVVQSKYIMSFIMMGISTVLAFAMLAMGKLIKPNEIKFLETGIGMATGIIIITICVEILLPFIFRLGAEKGRLAIILVFGGTFAAVMICAFLMEHLELSSDQALNLLIALCAAVVLPLILIAVSFISYKISLSIYMKKEF